MGFVKETNMESVTVVKIKNNVVDKVFLFQGEKGNITKQAEAKFLQIVKDKDFFPKGKEEADYLAELLLDDGFCEFKDGESVCISWVN